jgi:hypothetical protein
MRKKIKPCKGGPMYLCPEQQKTDISAFVPRCTLVLRVAADQLTDTLEAQIDHLLPGPSVCLRSMTQVLMSFFRALLLFVG